MMHIKWIGTLAATTALVLVIGGLLMAARRQSPPLLPVTTIPPATTIAADPPSPPLPGDPNEDEARVPGMVQLARWDVILNQTGADAVNKVLHPVPTASVVYAASTVNGAVLRRAVREAIEAGGLTRASDNMVIGRDWGASEPLHLREDLSFDYDDEENAPSVRINGRSDQGSDTLERTDDTHVHCVLNYPRITTTLSEGSDTPHTVGSGNKAIMFDGALAAGDAIAFLGKYPSYSEKAYYHLVVWETFKADPKQIEVMPDQRNADWWCENGPSCERAWANAARIWTARVPRQLAIAPAFQKTLSDGRVVRLEALYRPAKWPGAWWNGQGDPINDNNGMQPFHGDPPEGLFALISVVDANGHMSECDCDPADEDSGSVEVGIAVGPWKKIGTLELDKAQTINGVRYQIHSLKRVGPDAFQGILMRHGVLDNENTVWPTTADGQTAQYNIDLGLRFGHDSNVRRDESDFFFNDMPQGKIVSYSLMQHDRQWVKFTDFAMAPKTTPPVTATSEQALQAEAEALRPLAK